MNINRNNKRSVPTLVISGLGVVAAAITWLSFKLASAPAPPLANPNARATREQPMARGPRIKRAQDTQHATVGVTNLDLNRKPTPNQQAE